MALSGNSTVLGPGRSDWAMHAREARLTTFLLPACPLLLPLLTSLFARVGGGADVTLNITLPLSLSLSACLPAFSSSLSASLNLLLLPCHPVMAP
jgi:hypothetical protein